MRLIMQRAWNRAGYNIWIVQEDGDQYRLVKPVTLEMSEPQSYGFELPEPTLFLREREWADLKRSFHDEAISNGLYKDPIRLQGELEATRKHLGDMQRLVFEPNEWSKNK